MKITSKTVRVYLEPADFDGTCFENPFDCPGARAVKRYFGDKFSQIGLDPINVRGVAKGGMGRVNIFEIKGLFTYDDYLFIKEQYADPECNTKYYLTLIPVV